MEPRGKFITIEGGEGAGKTTQAKRLADALNRAGIRAEYARSPGGTPVAEKLRAILKTKEPGEDLLPETELLLFGACHAQMCRYLLRPMLERGVTAVCDRFFDSTTVYQGFARGLSLEQVRAVNEFASGGLRPDLTVLLDLPVETGLSRGLARGGLAADRFDSETFEFHSKIRNGFLKLASLEPERFRIVDASGTADSVAQNIRTLVKHEFSLADL